jgi:hypothetical protein
MRNHIVQTTLVARIRLKLVPGLPLGALSRFASAAGSHAPPVHPVTDIGRPSASTLAAKIRHSGISIAVRLQHRALLGARSRRIVCVQSSRRHGESRKPVSYLRASESVYEAGSVGFARSVEPVRVEAEVDFEVCEEVGDELDVVYAWEGVGGALEGCAVLAA